MREICFLVGFVAVLMCGSTISAQDACVLESDVDVDHESVDFRPTERFAEMESAESTYADTIRATEDVNVEMIQQQQEGDYSPSDEVRELVAEEQRLHVSWVENDNFVSHPYYYPTCPYKRHWIPRFRYYTWRRASTPTGSTRTYYWSYWSIWYVDCVTKYCQNSYNWWKWWDCRFRCFEEYSYVWTYFLTRVYTYNVDGQFTGVTTGRAWLRIRLPRSCCCKRYWYRSFTSLQTCAVSVNG